MNTTRLKSYFYRMEKTERKSFAEKCETTVGQLQQIISKNRTCNPGLAINLDRESAGEILCDELCPNVDFAYLRNQPLPI